MTVPDLDRLLRAVDSSWRSLGFLEIGDMITLAEDGIHLLDPFSTLVSPTVKIEPGVVLAPNVVLSIGPGGRIRIGGGTRLSSGTRIVANGGSVTVGKDAEIGDEGGFSLKASAGVTITVGSRVRLTGGGTVSGSCTIGDGAQIIGSIDVRTCRLAGGGDYNEPDPDRRGAVFKGFGQARDIDLALGQVIQGFGPFSKTEARMQSDFHPPPASGSGTGTK